MTAAPPLAAVVALASAYALGARRLWRRAGSGRVVHTGQAVAFAAGLLVVAAALAGPLDGAAHHSLVAHMFQHVALMSVAAPLLVAGTPVPALLWALPDAPRRAAARWWRWANHSAAGRAWPRWTAAALLAHVAAVWGWHVPRLYDAAMTQPGLHVLEHACFLGTAAALWWTVMAARHRASFGFGVLVVFATALQGTLLGAAMTVAGHPWYAAYARGASALEDQQVAGVVMWAIGGFAAVVAAAVLFASWLRTVERLRPASAPTPGRGRPLLLQEGAGGQVPARLPRHHAGHGREHENKHAEGIEDGHDVHAQLLGDDVLTSRQQ